MKKVLLSFSSFWFCLMSLSFAQQPAKKKGISVGEPPADHSPEAELKSFKVLDGFEVNLFASEADGIPNPIAIRWDERGRLWVLQTSDYPQAQPGAVSDDKIIILEDTDHDGRADKRTTFTGGLSQPMGMELAPRDPGVKSPNGHSIYVGEGEKLWLMHDDDGDDHVDRREVVLRGFGTGDTHQCLNSFIWAPDGALVMHQGLHCYSRVTTAHGTKTLYGAGFWHYYPKSGRLNPYPTGMPLNAWGTAFTKEGQPIMVAGAAGMFWARPMEVSTSLIENADEARERKDTQVHAIPHFLLERFQLPYSGQIIKTDGLRKFCGIDIVGNSHWPDAMQEEIISGGFFENAVYRYKLVPDQEFPSGMQAVEQPPLITSDNVAFRPIDIRFGPEGALYIADWYDPIIGHYQASFRHPHRDAKHGRIWRMVAKGREVKILGYMGLAEEKGLDLIDAYMGKSRWEAYQASRMLRALSSEEVIFNFLDWTRYNDDESLAPWAKQGLASIQIREWFEKIQDDDFLEWEEIYPQEVAPYSTRTLGTFASQLPDVSKHLERRVVADSRLVRLEAVVAAAKVQSPEAIKVALKVLDKPMDSFIERALWLAVHGTAPQWKKPPFEILNSLPPKHLAFLVEKEGSVELLSVVRKRVAEKGETMPAETRRGLVAALVRKGEPNDMLLALKLGLKDQAMLDDLATAAKQRSGKLPEGAEAVLMEMLQSGTEAQQAAACVLTGEWRLRSAESPLRELLKAGDGTRAAALMALSRLSAPAETFAPWVSDAKQPWPVRVAALTAVAEKKPALAGQLAGAALASIADVDTMRVWLTPLLAREAAVAALAQALDAKPCSPEAAKLAMTTLTAAGRGDAMLTTAFGKILGVKNTVPVYDAAWVATLAKEVAGSGNAGKGKAVFNAPLSGCIACHKIGGQGGVVGPELDAVGRGVPVELLIEAVVWPNRQIKEGYVATTLTLKDGRHLQGYKVSEAGGELQLRDLLGGQVSRFTPAQIQEKQEAGSLMPEGLIMNMTREELRDLIAYLAGLGR